MVVSLLLARAGVEVTVLEKHGDFLRDFRGDTVHPSTMELLDELGLGERFNRLPQSRLTRIAFPVVGGRLIVVGDVAREEPSFSLRMRCEVTGLIREDGRVRGVEYRTADGSTNAIHADLVIGCDGRWSITRQQADLRPREYSVSIDAWWFRLPRRPDDNPSALMPHAGPGRFAVVIPRPDFYQIAYIGRKGTDAQLRARGVEAFRRDIAELVPWLADRVGELASMDDVKHLDVRLNRLDPWHIDGLLCIGDAAHAMSPVGGVGINLAVQDAVAAAKLLAEPLRQGTITQETLARVRSRRLLPTILVQELQRLMHKVVVEPIIQERRMGPPKLS